jgi:hypothetical protein
VSDAIRQTRVIQRPACHRQHRQGRAPVDSSPYRPAGQQVKIMPRSAGKSGIAQELGIEFVVQPLVEENFEAALDDHLSERHRALARALCGRKHAAFTAHLRVARGRAGVPQGKTSDSRVIQKKSSMEDVRFHTFFKTNWRRVQCFLSTFRYCIF